jgi:hypothetical protein
VYKAHSLVEWAVSFARMLAWPIIATGWAGALMWLPLGITGLAYLRSSDEVRPRLQLAVAIGIWSILQSAGLAYGRGALGAAPSSRYMDILTVGWLLNGVIVIESTGGVGIVGRFGRRLFPALWLSAAAVALLVLSVRAWRGDAAIRGRLCEIGTRNVRAFVQTGDIEILRRAPFMHIPLWSGDDLAGHLTNATLRSILPASVCPALPLHPDRAEGFAQSGFPEGTPREIGERGWGSFTAQGEAQTGEFASALLPPPSLPYLRFEVAGGGAQSGISLLLRERTGAETAIRLGKGQGEAWRTVSVHSPRQPFQVVACDASSASGAWLAFREPRPAGRLTVWAGQIVRTGTVIASLCLGLLVALMACDAARGAQPPTGAD